MLNLKAPSQHTQPFRNIDPQPSILIERIERLQILKVNDLGLIEMDHERTTSTQRNELSDIILTDHPQLV